MTINFDNLPVEPTVTLITPEGKDLITTNNPIAILFARLEIKHHKWTGYKIRTAHGVICEINSNGKIKDYPDGDIPCDVYGDLLTELI
jgi:hypothetical protein